MLKLSLFLITIISIAIAYRNENNDLAESKELLINELLDEMEDIENGHHLSNREDDYLKIFGSLATEEDENGDFGEILKPKQKRFLKGIFDKIFGSSEKTTESPSTLKTKSTTKYTTSRLVSPIKKVTTGESDDAFYKLKIHCTRTYDKLCWTKKQELYDLIKRCKVLTNGNSKPIQACDDVLSIYCYVFYDFSTCYDQKYRPYVPNQPNSSTKLSSTKAPIQIPIKIITSSRYTTTRTSKPWKITTTKKSTSYRPTNRPSSNNLNSPFDGPVNSVPKDAKKLKEIGEYCLSHKDINCDKMLILLKNEFKKCEIQPKTDRNCQSFKMEFCKAFKSFPCCPDVLAGRQCNGRSNSLKRSYFNL